MTIKLIQELNDSPTSFVDLWVSCNNSSSIDFEFEVDGKFINQTQDKTGAIQLLRSLGVSEIDGFPIENIIQSMGSLGKEYKILINKAKYKKVMG